MNIKTTIVVLTAATCAACATNPVIEPIDPDTVLLRENEPLIYAPIPIWRSPEAFETLEPTVRKAILDHNNVFWCRNAETRPDAFPAEEICK